MRAIYTLLIICIVQISYSQTLYPYAKGGKMGFCDENKTVVIQPVYDNAKPFRHGLAFVRKGNYWGAVNKTGKVVIPVKYQLLQYGYAGFVVADSIKFDVLNGKLTDARVALFDSTGKRIYKAKFNALPAARLGYYDTEPYHSFCEKGKWGIMDLKYKIVAPAKYDNEIYFNGEWARVEYEEKKGVMNAKGTMIIPYKYDDLEAFDNWGHAVAKLKGKYGVIDIKDNVIVDFKYDDINICWNTGYMTPKIGGKIGLLDRNGKEIIPCSLSYPVFIFDNGLRNRQPEGSKLYGYVDTTGKYVIEAQYDESRPFHAGKALVKKDSKWFYINNKNEKITPEYDDVYTNCFSDTLYIIFKQNDTWGVADPNGNTLFTLPGVNKIKSFCGTYEYYQAEVGDKYGVVNLKGEWLVKPDLPGEVDYEDGLLLYTYDEQTGPINSYGEQTWVTVEKYYILPNGTKLKD